MTVLDVNKSTTDPHNEAILSEEAFARRQEVYEEIKQKNGGGTLADESEVPPEEGAPEDLAFASDQDTDTPPEVGDKDQENVPPKEEEAEDLDSEEEPPDEKMVPLNALHESRSETKEAKNRIRLLESQLSEVVAGYKTAVAASTPPVPKPVEEEPIADIDAAIRTLQAENRELRQVQTTTDNSIIQAAKDKAVEVEEQAVAKVDAELVAEGLPGFSAMALHVGRTILDITDESERLSYQNPEGWKKMYREQVYPKYSSIFVKKARKDKFAKKDAAAEKASLLSSSERVKRSSASKEKTHTYTEYLELRAKDQVF